MRIVGIHLEPGGVGWHRVWCWTEAMERRGHDVWHRQHVGTQFEWPEIDGIVNGADVVIAGRMHNAQTFAGLLAGRDLYHYKLVVDTDDCADLIPTYNQAFSDYHGGAGTARIVRAELAKADLVTVSTEALAKHVRQYSHRVVVVPNVIDTRPHSKVRIREKEARHRDDLRIYWGGGGGHYDDLRILKEPLLRIMSERPNVKLVFSNFIPDWAADLPPLRCFMVRFAHFNAYPKVLKWLCADVAVAPLIDNEFNRCKSHVKYLAYAMADIPGVYQDLAPYDSVTHGLNGLKATTPDTWYEAINVLLDNRVLASEIAKRAKQDVMVHHNVDDHGLRYETILRELVGSPKVELTHLNEGVPLDNVVTMRT